MPLISREIESSKQSLLAIDIIRKKTGFYEKDHIPLMAIIYTTYYVR